MIRILIVDDNEALVDLLKERLDMEDRYYVTTALNGEEGYAAFKNFKPDIILTDIEMPLKNGLEMVKNIRVHHPAIKAIYMSGNSYKYRGFLAQEKAKYKADLLNKPFAVSQVIKLFREYQNKGGYRK